MRCTTAGAIKREAPSDQTVSDLHLWHEMSPRPHGGPESNGLSLVTCQIDWLSELEASTDYRGLATLSNYA